MKKWGEIINSKNKKILAALITLFLSLTVMSSLVATFIFDGLHGVGLILYLLSGTIAFVLLFMKETLKFKVNHRIVSLVLGVLYGSIVASSLYTAILVLQ